MRSQQREIQINKNNLQGIRLRGRNPLNLTKKAQLARE